jgi:hypothetical protein
MTDKIIQKYRIILQINAGTDDRPRWLMLDNSVITEHTTLIMMSDILENLRKRLIVEMQRKPEDEIFHDGTG